MIKVALIGLRRTEKIVDESSTIRTVLSENGLLQANNDYTLNLNALPEPALDATFQEMGIRNGESCTLTSIARKSNA